MTEEYKKIDLSKNEVSLLISCLQASMASNNRYIEEGIQAKIKELSSLSYSTDTIDRINTLTDIIDSINNYVSHINNLNKLLKKVKK